MPEPPEVGFDLSEHFGWQSPAQISAEKGIVVVLIAERWRILKELAHGFPE